MDRNITLNQPGDGGDGCNGQDISMGVGGIAQVVVYNISDIASLKFENDNRADDSLVVDTINSTGQFYKIDFTSATYNEEYDNHKWTHTLTLDIANIQPLFEDILADGVNGKYLVCFRPNGSEDWRMFGWKYGAKLDYSLNITDDSLGYTVTLDDASEYPLFAVYADNFGDKNKTYTPLFKPLYDVYYCEQDQYGYHTGYLIAMYVVKVNAAGQPLGSDNKLCQWTGKKQDAYKINTIQSDGGYNIIGTYTKDATFDGKPVMILDYDKCPANVTNSIFINSKKAETISLNSTISAGTFTITSTDDWMMVTDPQFVTISPVEGVNGNTQCRVHHNGVGGCEQIEFMNKETGEIVTLDVCVNLINVGSSYTYDCNTNEVVITPSVEGCSSAYTYTISPATPNTKDSYGYIHLWPSGVTSSTTYTITFTHGCDSNEVKVTTVKIVCNDTNPIWQLQKSYCEKVDGEYTNYRISIYVDINPYSDTYSNRKTEKEYDATCADSPATWQLESSYCELDVEGANTGYYISVYMDVNPDSPTYETTREERVLNATECPEPNRDPDWIKDPDFSGYCEQIFYEPGHVEGNSGYWIDQEIDDNRLSPTYKQTRPVKVLSDDCPVPNTNPIVEEISSACELEYDEQGNLVMNGWVNITGLDTNVFSSTYLQVTTVREYDEEKCPPSGGHDPSGCTAFIVDGGHWDEVPAVGSGACDSAFLYVEGTPVFTPASASGWVTVDFSHWDEDPHDYQHFCSLYDVSPCVAESFFRHAGISTDPKPQICTDNPAAATVSDMPQVVADAITGNTEYTHALGTIWYRVAQNTGNDPRSCVIKWYVDDMSEECMSAEFRITQLGTGGGGGCDCTNYSISSAGATVPATTSNTEYTVGTYVKATGCDQEIYNAGLNNGSDFLGSFRFSGGYIYAKVKTANTSTSTRYAQYKIKQGNCEGYVNITQAAAPVPQENKFEWNWQGHEQSYSATVSGNATVLNLIQFTSYYNGSQPNAVLSSSDSWIITNNSSYINGNELPPNINDMIFLQPNNTNYTRVGTLTLTQKGTSNKIRVYITQGPYVADCSITSFSMSTNVCKGDNISYSFDVADTRCTQTFYFTFYDANNNPINSTAVPSNGHGSGTFSTSNAATGNGVVVVTVGAEVKRYVCEIRNCSSPTPDLTVQYQLHNSTGQEVYYNYIDFYKNSQPSAPLSLGVGTDAIMVGATKRIQKTVSYTLNGWSWDYIKVRDTFSGLNHTYTTSNAGGTFADNISIYIDITGIERSVSIQENEEPEEIKGEENPEETK